MLACGVQSWYLFYEWSWGSTFEQSVLPLQFPSVHAILSSPRHRSSQTAAIRQQELTQKRTLFSVSTYLNQALLFVFISFLVLSPLWLLGVLLLKAGGMMMMEL
jgi:hypothetical protein